ncbi:ATP-binding protein [uncultured Shewanella sp.]|uniref:ATP/GTP-binding protein n=1 Tax=uncultured Shewanella sp. TaxID=173975 RepID=UPI002606C6DE|nr:ATP-binding protein [uncultured Shewanella sp.]
MRIAISGTHCVGKTRLIDDLIIRYPEYQSMKEVYYELLDEEDGAFALEPTIDNMLKQLDASIEQLEQQDMEKNIIFDRCPLDFIAYAMHAAELDSIDIHCHEISERFPQVIEILNQLDLIVFLPMTEQSPVFYAEENPEYRKAVDKYFKRLYRDDELYLFPNYNQPKIVEIFGSPQERVEKMSTYL